MRDPRPLAPEEVALLTDRTLFAIKARVQAQVRASLDALRVPLAEACRTMPLAAPAGFDSDKFQLVKGEHLEDCPYQYLDAPKYFAEGTAFTFRSLVWWGHHAVFAWLLEGEGLVRHKRAMLARYQELAGRDLCLGIAPGLWEWKVGAGFTLPLEVGNRTQVAAVLDRRTSLKVCRVVPLDEPALVAGRLADVGMAAFRALLPVVCAE